MTATNRPTSLEAADKFVTFVNASPTPFHAVQNASSMLEKAGFTKLVEDEKWNLKGGGKYFFTRNQASLLAFTLPQKWEPGTGASIVATHVDSPNLRIRPVSKKSSAGYLQVGVETYGGGIWHSWLDRDLSIAGRVIISDGSGNFNSKLIKVNRPLIRIPTLAIHLERGVNDCFKFNQETEMVPVLGLISAQLNAPKEEKKTEEVKLASSIRDDHHPALLSVLAEELSVKPEQIHDFELHLYDTQPSTLGGVNNEFIFSPRMDNLVSSFCAVEALTQMASYESFPHLEGNVNVIALFNHEEVGSVSSTGAESSIIPSLLNRLSPNAEALNQSIARSFLISADMGHAVHPNYTSKHEENHKPVMNGGIVLKINAKQRYTTDSIGAFLVRRLVERKGGRVQVYEVRNDMSCGSTVGPMLSKIGVRTVDVGNAMLSMHSIRETAGSHDVQHAIDLFSSLFEGFATLDKTLSLE
ncbi:aspartyl aminopeptidase [Fomitiporia mediterranea MF3/22]|uniref:aspartyl aminopeptidase n=1 Tax=Fomitiporia mediterranea (strain MF3/22) TaxID=694068 RepID=UPI0004409B33|nr:aspartyl aminopeptidase [Fomitiporia mediterranea MF3/22]EJD01371.1 aspartyl aminopeptidase [Fomitiporia mediterranea MF3/22]